MLTHSTRPLGFAIALVLAFATLLAAGGIPAAHAAPGDLIVVTDDTGALTSASQLTTGADGNLWVVSGNHLARVTPAGAVAAFPIPGSFTAFAITTGADGHVWFSTGGTAPQRTIGRIAPAGDFTLFPSSLIDFVDGMTLGPDGNVWAASSNNRLVRVTPDGAMTAFSTGPLSPTRVTTGPDGNLWFTSRDNRVGYLTIANGTVTSFAVPGGQRLRDLAVGSDGNVWFLGQQTVYRITTAGEISSFTAPDLNGLEVIVAGTDGALWFTSGATDRIGRISTDGTITTYSSNPLGYAQGITVGPEGLLWVGGSDNQVARVGSSPTTTSLVASGPTSFGQPVSFTATVCTPFTGGFLPTGSVRFTVDGAGFGDPVAVGAADGGGGGCVQATSTSRALSGGPHTIAATFAPGTGFDASTGTLDYTVAPAPGTTLVAEPVVARVAPTRVTLGMVEARLADGSGAPLAGESLAFTAGGQQLCTAVTDGDGVGRCGNLVTTLQAVLGLGYQVTFAGDTDHVGATAHGPIAIVMDFPIF